MQKIQPKSVAEHPMAARLLAGVLMRHAQESNDTAVMRESQELAAQADRAQLNQDPIQRQTPEQRLL